MKKQRTFKKTERGMALVESIPVLFTIVILFNFSLGFFGAIHSGILNSIASYNYTLETFRFRSNLMYFRPGAEFKINYEKARNRVHGTIQDGNTPTEQRDIWPATIRAVSFSNNNGPESSHKYADRTSDGIWSAISTYIPTTRDAPSTPEIWIKTVYGICLNADCEKKP
jgi:hypothetical protein